MIIPYKPFKRERASREAKSIYIFSEGTKREVDYFNYFAEMDSRINLKVHKLGPKEDNSPLGLLSIAEKCIIKDETDKKPQYNFIEDLDEVWIVVDIDKDKFNSRKPSIEKVKQECSKRRGWYLVRSNPCFEVWLYNHKYDTIPDKPSEKCTDWKKLVNDSIPGGFDSRRHPLFIKQARDNAKKNFSIVDNIPAVGTTEVYQLADSILPLITDKLERVLSTMHTD